MMADEFGTPFWDDNQTGYEGLTYPGGIWDLCQIAGETLPGRARVSGLPLLTFDKKESKGLNGAAITVNGYLPGPVEVELLMWTPDQLVAFDKIAPKIWIKPTKKKTLGSEIFKSIYHPALALWNISQVIILGVSVPKDGPEPGTKIVQIKCVEYVAIVKNDKPATPKAAAPIMDPRLTGNAAESPGAKVGPKGERKP